MIGEYRPGLCTGDIPNKSCPTRSRKPEGSGTPTRSASVKVDGPFAMVVIDATASRANGEVA